MQVFQLFKLLSNWGAVGMNNSIVWEIELLHVRQSQKESIWNIDQFAVGHSQSLQWIIRMKQIIGKTRNSGVVNSEIG